MQRPQIMTGLAGLLVLIIGVWAILASRDVRDKTVTLTFQAQMGGEPLVYDQFIYDNPGGEGVFEIHDFKFFISNLSLSQGGETYVVPDSYHLLRFDNDSLSHSITLTDVPLRDVEYLRFLVGLDAQANTSPEMRDKLDPEGQMAWSREDGYKFVVFEGALRIGETVSLLTYHVGFSENTREISVSLPAQHDTGGKTEIALTVDLSKMFAGSYEVDMGELPSVDFDRDGARMLADNYASMVSFGF
ncbi:MbnP family protein [Ruegeria lacuscaerulensis]|uniref:MbnP family protein n=2 Tax=Ruegeria lacuscaerulensis TaxID=55218 RepID=UPI00147EFBCE|nr:MbnP family protein [Ruegeria lacuscaerulensis]